MYLRLGRLNGLLATATYLVAKVLLCAVATIHDDPFADILICP
jgi:hypothetical protein